MDKKFYITTAIPYASAKPHIGNTYEAILADAIARYKRLDGFDVYFQTGTDEHGQKVEEKAKEQGITPQEFADKNSNELRRIWDLVGTSYNKFVKTTDPNHKKIVQKIFKKLYQQGDIYKDTYEGLYCTPCESFWTEKDLIDGKCPDCGREVHVDTEEGYFLRTTKYQDRLLKYIEDHPDFIRPESRKNEIVNNFIKPGLKDLCVSRTSFKWGVQVDFDPDHVVYVWIDALSNYITFLGYDVDNTSDNFKKFWPADIHIIGKDILRFHTIYWPILLMALDVELPHQIFGHPWLLSGGDKMSKSKGNVMYADDLVELFGVDAIRYYVLNETPFANDGTITYELLIDTINSDLANTLGNLVNRTITMANKYFNGNVSNKNIEILESKELLDITKNLKEKVTEKVNSIEIGNAIKEIFVALRRANKYIDETEPWVLYKNKELDKLETVIYTLLDTIRICAILLQAFIPETANKILDQLNINDRTIEDIDKIYEFQVREPEILFQRIDVEIKLEEINVKNSVNE